MPDFRNYLSEAPQEIIDALNQELAGVDPEQGGPGLFPSASATTTVSVTHLYANGSTGSDSNDGLSSSTPKATLQAVFDLVPDIVKHTVVIHLEGSFSLPPQSAGVVTHLSRRCDIDESLYTFGVVIDGGDAKTDILAATTATSGSASELTVAAAGWTLEAYTAYYVEVLDGPAAGEIRICRKNTADTVEVASPFSTDPTNCGAFTPQFRVFKWATTITCSDEWTSLTVSFFSSAPIESINMIQRLTFTSPTQKLQLSMNGTLRLGAVCIDTISSMFCASGRSITIGSYVDYDLVTEGIGVNTYGGGCGVRDISSTLGLLMRNCEGAFQADLVLAGTWGTGLNCESCTGIMFGRGSRSAGVPITIVGQRPLITTELNGVIGKLFGGNTPEIDGVRLFIGGQSDVSIDALDVSNSPGHGIEVNNSALRFIADVVTGLGNVGAGVYAHNNSVVNIKDGFAPTLSGMVGDLAIANPVAEEETWANIDGGTKVAIAAEMTIVKEV